MWSRIEIEGCVSDSDLYSTAFYFQTNFFTPCDFLFGRAPVCSDKGDIHSKANWIQIFFRRLRRSQVVTIFTCTTTSYVDT